ncbi:MAG: imelysin family protein [Bradymonadia bacterium]
MWKNSLLLTSAFAALMVVACDDQTENGNGAQTTPAESEARKRLLRGLRENVYAPTFEQFANSSNTLKSACLAWQAERDEAKLETLKQAWRDAMTDWQRAELMQIGPSGASGRRIGGQDYRDRIYSYPISNSCRVDQELVRGSFTEPGWVNNAQFNIRGLDAMEYLIFGISVQNTCPQTAGINRDGEWDALKNTPDVFSDRRAAYLVALATGVAEDAQTLMESWTDEEGTFGSAFVNASAPFNSQKEVLDQVFAGIFYTDKFIKDLKLGTPAGITDDCIADVCPDMVESKWSGASKTNLLVNLDTLELIFRGGNEASQYGFDDLLIEEGAMALTDRMNQHLNVAKEKTTLITTSVEEQLNSNPEVVRNAHVAVRDITDDLKTQFVTVLNLSVPQEGAGDND